MVEQRAGVDVLVTDAGPEVEPVAPRRADRLALAHLVAAVDGDRLEERIGRADAVGVQDDDVERTADLAREGDLAVGGRLDGRALGRGVIDAPVAGLPLAVRQPELVDHGPAHRRAVGDSGHSAAEGGGAHRAAEGGGAAGCGAAGCGAARGGGGRSSRKGRDCAKNERGSRDGHDQGQAAHGDPQGRTSASGGKGRGARRRYGMKLHQELRGRKEVMQIRAAGRRAWPATAVRPWCGSGTPGSR